MTNDLYHKDALRDRPVQQHHRDRKWNAIFKRHRDEIRGPLDALGEGDS